MIPVTRLDGQQVVINGMLVEKIESIPDTIISLTSGRKILVRESVSDLIRLMTNAYPQTPAARSTFDTLCPEAA